MEKYSVEDLDKLYSRAEQVDKAHFAEQRTNILLYFGDHYKARAKKFLERTKDQLSEDTKLRLQENHVQKIANEIQAGILNSAPGVTVVPANEKELQDQKDAELSLSVIKYGESQNNFEDLLEKLVNDFVVTGEMIAMIQWNPTIGKFIGYEQATDDEGNPLFVDAMTGMTTADEGTILPTGEIIKNEMLKSDKARFSGQLEMKLIHPFNFKRHPNAETIDQSPWVVVDEMLDKNEAKNLIAENIDDREAVVRSIDNTNKNAFKIFEPSTGEYIDSEDRVLVKTWFFRACEQYPKGYWKIQIADKIVSEGELPFGLWPIVFEGFRTVAGTPRAKSFIRDIRQPQVELNRLISQQAYHTLALGDDKIITSMGGKVNKGTTFNGIREFNVQGPGAITVLPGRDGAQFSAAITRCVDVMYKLSPIDSNQEMPGQQDTLVLLYAKLSQKKKLSAYAKKVERFLIKLWSLYIDLSKQYFDEQTIIKATGRREAINIAEFKNQTSDGYRIQVLAANSDIESMIGKSVQIQQMLQYVGKDLPNTVKARLARMMPFMNDSQALDELLIDDENIDSDILALDRGEFRPASKIDNHELYVKRLNHRMKQTDYGLLNDQIKQMYDAKIEQHQDFMAQIAQELKQAQSEFIPTSGALVKADLYDNNGKRVSLPYDSLQWLLKQLQSQGTSQQSLQQLDEKNQADILNKALQMNQTMGQQQPQDMLNQNSGQSASLPF